MGKEKSDIFQMQQEEYPYKEIGSINQIEYIRISEATHQKIRKHIKKDETLKVVLTTTVKG